MEKKKKARIRLRQVFEERMEKELPEDIKAPAAMFQSTMTCREPAFKYAQRNYIDVPFSWIREKKQVWLSVHLLKRK